ncbi:MAG: type II toxin-antitoxin system VapC family toxin [Terracidiphilus sp.]
MKLLLDTHTILWAMLGDPKLSAMARSLLEDDSNEVFVSVVCIWEIATKVRIGKMPEPGNLLKNPQQALEDLGYRDLPLTLSHARLGGLLVHPHKDPFDRMLAAQAILESLILVSIDSVFDGLPVVRRW